MAKFAQGRYSLKNADKYLGRKTPLYRSSWELAFMRFCDESTSVSKWASESVKIPYKDPLTGKLTVYVPDFMIQYSDARGKGYVELIEVKAENQMKKSGLDPKIIIDCSHANSNKDHKKQPIVFENILTQKLKGNKSIVGLMLESHINEGNQSLSDPNNLKYGVSITDACINWETTNDLITDAQKKLKK